LEAQQKLKVARSVVLVCIYVGKLMNHQSAHTLWEYKLIASSKLSKIK